MYVICNILRRTMRLSIGMHSEQRLNYARGDFLKLYYIIKSHDRTALYDITNVHDAANYFQEKMLEAVCQAVPRTKKSPYSRYPPWLTCEIIRTIKLKEKARKKYKNNCNTLNLQHYQSLRQKSKKMIRQAHRNHLTGIQNEIITNPKIFWKNIKSKKTDSSHPSILRVHCVTKKKSSCARNATYIL